MSFAGINDLAVIVAAIAGFMWGYLVWDIRSGISGLGHYLLAALLVWLGFVLTTSSVNNAFRMRPLALTSIDAGHWLVVLLVMGAVIGLFGV